MIPMLIGNHLPRCLLLPMTRLYWQYCYAGRAGKHQGQRGITIPTVKQISPNAPGFYTSRISARARICQARAIPSISDRDTGRVNAFGRRY